MIPKIDFPLQWIIPNLTFSILQTPGNGAWSAWGQVITAANLTYDFVL